MEFRNGGGEMHDSSYARIVCNKKEKTNCMQCYGVMATFYINMKTYLFYFVHHTKYILHTMRNMKIINE